VETFANTTSITIFFIIIIIITLRSHFASSPRQTRSSCFDPDIIRRDFKYGQPLEAAMLESAFARQHAAR